MGKQALRTLMKQKLDDAYSAQKLEELSTQLSKNLKQLVSKLNSQRFTGGIKLGVYAPLKFEPIWWHEFDDESVGEYLLVHMGEKMTLSYHPVELSSIKENHHELELCDNTREKEDTPNVLLIPGMAFTKYGERLGKGKAYFDNFLKDFEGVRIGVFFSFQEALDVYGEAHDEEMDYIVTDKDIFTNKGKIK